LKDQRVRERVKNPLFYCPAGAIPIFEQKYFFIDEICPMVIACVARDICPMLKWYYPRGEELHGD